MKNCIWLLPAFLVLSFAAQSQGIRKGDKLFGGSFSLSFFNINGSGYSYSNAGNAGLLPSFGWAVKENLVLGVKGSISYSRSSAASGVQDKSKSSSLSAGPGVFLKKYKLLKNQFGVYFNNELNLFYTLLRQENSLFGDPVTNDAWGGSYNFNPGVFYKFSDRFLGEANIGGLFLTYYKNNASDNFGVGASFLQYFNLGVNYVIGKKK